MQVEDGSALAHEDLIGRWLKKAGTGVEIGAFDTPIPGIQPFYVDCFEEYSGKRCLADYWGDACHLPFRKHSLDYVATSHVFEHVANPVAALLEWDRVLLDGGYMYMVVPDRRYTFDYARDLTTPEHMWEDFEDKVSQADGTHAFEFVDGVDWAMYRPEVAPEDLDADRETMRNQYVFDIEHKKEFNIHFHVFEPDNLQRLVELVAQKRKLRWKIVKCIESFPRDNPNGILLVVRVRKPFLGKFHSLFRRMIRMVSRNWVLEPDARPISESDQLRKKYLTSCS